MNTKRIISLLLMLIVMSGVFSGCRDADVLDNGESTQESILDSDMPGNTPIDTVPTDAEPSVPDLQSIDIETTGGCVIVGKINVDDRGWYIEPEQPLNITYNYFLDNPSVFLDQTRIAMFDPQVDGVEKAVYIGTAVEYAPAVEFGHKQEVGRYVPAIGKRLVSANVPPKPFLKPAIEGHLEEFKSIMEQELSEIKI